MRRKKGWRSPASTETVLVYGADGPGYDGAVLIELQTVHAPLAGDMGRPVGFLRGDPAVTYSGWIASPQSFRGAAQMGSTPTPPWAPPPALPAPDSPPAFVSWVNDWTQLEGLVP
jgi:hypothetical protein